MVFGEEVYMKRLYVLILCLSVFIAGCNSAANDRDPISLDTEEASENTEGLDETEEESEEIVEIPEEYAGLGVETFTRNETGVTSTVTLEFEDNIVLQQTTLNTGNFADIGLTLETAREQVSTLATNYASTYDVTYETELIDAGGNETVLIDYRNQRDDMETLESLFMDEIPKIDRDTTVEEAIEYFVSEGYTHDE